MSDVSGGRDLRKGQEIEAVAEASVPAAPEGTLAAAIAGSGPHPLAVPAPPALVVDLIAQLATQLGALHTRRQVYGTLDPDHVLLWAEPGEAPRVELAAPDHTGERDTFAISGFTAPEHFEGECGQAADEYSLSALAYLLLTGEPAFVGSPAEQAFEQLFAAPEPPRRINPDLPFAVSAVVMRALAKWPEDRYSSVADFAVALRYAAGETPESAVPLPPWLRQTSAPSRPFVVTRRDSADAPASVLPPRGLAPLEEPPPAAHEEAGAWRAAAPPPIVSPPAPSPEPRPRYPLLSPRARHVQIAAACALLIALVLGAGLAMAAAAVPHPRATAPAVVRAPATSPPLPLVTLPPMPSPTPTVAPTNTPTPTPTTGPVGNPSSGDTASVGAIVAPASVAPGQRFTVRITLTNTGHTTWSSGAGYALVCDTARHPTTSCSSAFSAGLGNAVVTPGGSVTFTVTLIAPSGSGTYQAWFAMAHNGRLFSSADAEVRVAVS